MKRTVMSLALFLVVVCAAGQTVQAQSIGPVGFSLTDQGDLGGKEIGREELLFFNTGQATRLLFSGEGFAFMIGDLDGDGVEDLPGNVNAFHVEPSTGTPLPDVLYFSFSTDCCGFKDGDVLRFQDLGGVVVHLPESYFITVAGATDGNVDVDAFTLRADGHLFFSFADTEDSNLLSGSQPGIVEDGDIIHVDAQGSAEVLYNEDEVSAMVSAALGKTVSAGDVLGLALNPITQELLFTVQSPTDHDATLFTESGGGMIVPGYDEDSLGFSNEVEIDGFSLLPVMDDLPALEIEPRYPAQGDTILITLSGGTPNGPFCLLISGAVAPSLNPPYLGGFGAVLLDMNHPYFKAGFQGIAQLSGYCNPEGIGVFKTTLPVYPDPLDIHIQAMDALARVYAHPLTLEMNQ